MNEEAWAKARELRAFSPAGGALRFCPPYEDVHIAASAQAYRCEDAGVSWQITPRVLTEAMAAGGDEAKRAFDAMMTMKKLDVAAIEAARRG